MKKYPWILAAILLCAGCVTNFKASEYDKPANFKIERNAHIVNAIEAEGFTALAATSKFGVEPNDSMTSAIDASVKSILAANNPFNAISIEHDEAAAIVEDDLYIILILDKLKSYINVSRNRSVYELNGTFIIADGAGNVYSSKPYIISEESAIGTLQSAQDEAVKALIDAFFTVLARTDFSKPLEDEDNEYILGLIKSNL